ncbi:hypothetical protein LJB98_03835 [Bacteroidales bacterium OttesenSCG-928-M11]|nr:hypothetical protein [Bacteroidales bacterium OttesenSCG-928-M11]
MKDIADYIPLFLIIGSIILSFFQGKKKKEKDKLPQEQPIPYPDVEIEEDMYIPEAIVVEPLVDKLPKKETTSKTTSQRVDRKKRQHSAISEDDSSVDLDFSGIDELKKAIIYSEIINRKEY